MFLNSMHFPNWLNHLLSLWKIRNSYHHGFKPMVKEIDTRYLPSLALGISRIAWISRLSGKSDGVLPGHGVTTMWESSEGPS